jgi:hypothetical protein
MLYPSDLDDYLRGAGLSIQHLQIDRSVIYILDSDSRIVFCNWSWDRFAFQNGGIGLSHLRVLGTSVLDVTPSLLQRFYVTAYATARKTGKPWEHDFECSSPETFRLFHMRVLPIGGPYLCIENSLRIENLHEPGRADIRLETAHYRDENGLVVMCCHCRRTRRVRNIGSPRWDWVPEFLTSPPGLVSHGLCELCVRFFYAGTSPSDKSGETPFPPESGRSPK